MGFSPGHAGISVTRHRERPELIRLLVTQFVKKKATNSLIRQFHPSHRGFYHNCRAATIFGRKVDAPMRCLTYIFRLRRSSLSTAVKGIPRQARRTNR
jgi:hypothetical protein